MECTFCIDIYAPTGLRGIEPHLVHCELGLTAYQSGYNGKVILRRPLDSDFEWEMDSSDHATMFASGSIPGDAPAAEAKLRTLSTSLRLAGYPHRIALDDPSGHLAASIEYAWSPDWAP
jgi:hypothetical protein